MYELKNIIAAVALSIAIIVLYTLFFAPSPEEIKQNRIKQEQVQKDSDMPSVDQNENFVKITRNEALAENNRIQFENDDVVGSISLKGAIIDDLTFKKYNVVLNGKEKVVISQEKKVNKSYFDCKFNEIISNACFIFSIFDLYIDISFSTLVYSHPSNSENSEISLLISCSFLIIGSRNLTRREYMFLPL